MSLVPVAVAALDTGSITRTFADPAWLGDAPDSGGRGAFTGSLPPQFVEVDDACVLVSRARMNRCGTFIGHRGAGISHCGTMPRSTRIRRPRPGLPLQFRPHDGPGRRRIVDTGAL
ncbi:hypothetical protein [Nocardia cerradoensis]|uniref:hypothetical protein n=1 Tax=Nocardia cerradoensis TaxID=85688 RepID=UPI0012F674BD|nr:hypothetical protein [Nocardia cerradoensis]NKY44317.1 hypothetical protein [Nocardia cerradoensis]